MSDFESLKIGDLVNVTDYVANGSFAALKENVSVSEQPDYAVLVRLVDFNRGWTPPFSYVTEASYRFLKKSSLKTGDVVISNVGANAGTVFKVPDLGIPCTLGPNSVVCKIDEDGLLDRDYFFYFLKSAAGQHLLSGITGGSAQPKFNKTDLRSIEITFPDKRTQKAIAHVLGTLDDKIGLNQRMNQTLEDIAKAIFKSWFVDFDPVRAKAEGRPTGLPPEISDLFPNELVDSEIGEIPKGWRTSPLLSLCKKIESGGTPSRKTAEYWDAGTIPWFKTGEFCDSPLLKSEEHITPLGLNKSAAKEWAPQTILFAMYGATVGKMAYLTETGTANQAVAGIVPDENFGFAFVWQTLISGRSRLMSLANGAAQQNLNLGLVKDFTVITPSSELTRTFSNATSSIYQRITLLNKESDCLSELRDTLLPKLISGELRIADAEKFLEEAGI